MSGARRSSLVAMTNAPHPTGWPDRFWPGLLAALLAATATWSVWSLLPGTGGHLPLLAGIALLAAGTSAWLSFKSFETAASGSRRLGSVLGLLLSAAACVGALGTSAALLLGHYLGPLFSRA